jgi:hypothetical protein
MLQAYSNFIALGGKLAAGHKKKDRNPHCIFLVMNVPNITHHKKILQGGNIGKYCFFLNKKASKGPPVSTQDVKVHFRQRFDLCKEISCFCESLGYQYQLQRLL